MKSKNPLKEGGYLAFKFPNDLFDEEKLAYLSIENNIFATDKSMPFDAKKINYQNIVRIDKSNKDYLYEFVFLFRKPTEEELVQHLIKEERFDEIFAVKHKGEYRISTEREKQKQELFDIFKKKR